MLCWVRIRQRLGGSFAASIALWIVACTEQRPDPFVAEPLDAGAEDATLDITVGSCEGPPTPGSKGYCGNEIVPVLTKKPNLYFVIDASGRLVDGTAVSSPADLSAALLRRPEQFVQTFTEKLMTYALGRTLEYYDMPAVRKIVRDAAAAQYRFSAIVGGIVTSAPFQTRRAAGVAAGL